MVPIIGLDVGGANTKAAVVDGSGTVRVASEPFEVWRDPGAMAGVIADVVGRLGAGAMERVGAGAMERVGAGDARVAMTTTAELVDAFASKRDGVLHVLGAAAAGLPGCSVRVMTTDGALIALDEARAAPLRCAAANWMASALLVARSVPDAILIDCGGTTTDLIPIAGGAVVARGRTDVERLLAGELVYTGALRTNVAAVLSHAPVGGRPCPVASELFAVAADAHLLLGNLSPERCTCTFPDGRGTSAGEVRSRLARVVCADPEQLGAGDLEAIAAAVQEAQVAAIAAALGQVAARVPAAAEVIVVGVGAFLARAAAARCGLPVREHPALLLGGGPGEVAAAVALSVLGRD